jgi:hypothetical protein
VRKERWQSEASVAGSYPQISGKEGKVESCSTPS